MCRRRNDRYTSRRLRKGAPRMDATPEPNSREAIDAPALTLADMFALAQRVSPRLSGKLPDFSKRALTPAEEALAATLLRERLSALLSRCAAELWMERGATHLLTADEALAFGMVIGQITRVARLLHPLVEGLDMKELNE